MDCKVIAWHLPELDSSGRFHLRKQHPHSSLVISPGCTALSLPSSSFLTAMHMNGSGPSIDGPADLHLHFSLSFFSVLLNDKNHHKPVADGHSATLNLSYILLLLMYSRWTTIYLVLLRITCPEDHPDFPVPPPNSLPFHNSLASFPLLLSHLPCNSSCSTR